MTMTPRNLTHGQWSKNLTMATYSLESAPWSMIKMAILWSNFVVKSKVYHFDHRKFVFRPWTWWILAVVMVRNFDHLTMVIRNFGHGHGQKFLTI